MREVGSYRPFGEHGIARLLIVLAIVARHAVAVHCVGIDHIAERLADTCFRIMPDAVAHHGTALVRHDRTIHEPCPVVLGVIVAKLRIDMALARDDVGRADDVSHGLTGVIIERVSCEVELLVAHTDVVVKHSHLRFRVVLAPVGG